jgi:hypothetical protein
MFEAPAYQDEVHSYGGETYERDVHRYEREYRRSDPREVTAPTVACALPFWWSGRSWSLGRSL